MSLVKTFEFATTEEAWAQLNKYFLLKEEEIINRGGVRYGSKLVSHNLFLKIRRAYINPEFNYGLMFGYKIQKWSKLISNYVDLNYLDLVKSEVLSREAKKNNEYTVSFIFDNAHATGHGCLINLTFIRRPKRLDPIIQLTLRSSEITKRLIFDFLLAQRMAEYVFGPDQAVSVEVFLPNAYTTSEGIVMMENYFSVDKLLKKLAKKNGGLKPFQEKTRKILDYFKTVEPHKITYKVHLRSVRQLQKIDGIPISNTPPLLVKNLSIIK